MPNRPLTIEECRKVANERGGECLDDKYINGRIYMNWKCGSGHTWTSQFRKIKEGRWCRECSILNRKHTIKFCKDKAREKDGKCLSNVYVNSRTEMEWECKEGHIWPSCFENIQQGHWCPECAGIKKLTIEECHKVAKERGGECLETKYVNNREKMHWKCSEGHIWPATFAHIKNRGDWCKICAGHMKLTLDDCRNTAQERGGGCLSTEYIHKDVVMDWVCKDGHKWSTTYGSIRQGTWCDKCVRLTQGDRTRLNIDECKQHAENMGGECLSEEYKSAHDILEWKCKEGHIWKTAFSCVKYSNTWCPYCSHSKTEKLCRQIIEELTNKKFPSVRPDFLRHEKTGYNLELDGYNEELQMAFEYNGIQHYKYCPDFFHKKGKNTFIEQQERDKLKIETCNKLGIKVLVIPYHTFRDEDELRLIIKSLI